MWATASQLEKQNSDVEKKKMFLLSLLPEIESITREKMSSFRQKVLQFIDSIMNPTQYDWYLHVQSHQQMSTGSLASSTNSSNQHYYYDSSKSSPSHLTTQELQT